MSKEMLEHLVGPIAKAILTHERSIAGSSCRAVSQGEARKATRKAADIVAAIAPLIAGASAVAEPVAWCQPMDCGKHTPRKFLLYFEDADRGIAVFDDEAEARGAFDRADTAWNCYLFGALPKAVAHPAQAAPVPASVREALEPFAEAWFAYGDKPSDETPLSNNAGAAYLEGRKITFGDLRRAAQALASLPAPEAAPTREEYAAVLAQELWCGATFADAAPSEREAFLRAVDAILALKAAPAK